MITITCKCCRTLIKQSRFIVCIDSTGGVDYESGPYTVTFHAGQTSVSFNVSLTDDKILEPNEQFVLTINSSSLPNGFTVDNPSQVVVTIIDNDSECHLLVHKLTMCNCHNANVQ